MFCIVAWERPERVCVEEVEEDGGDDDDNDDEGVVVGNGEALGQYCKRRLTTNMLTLSI